MYEEYLLNFFKQVKASFWNKLDWKIITLILAIHIL